MHIHPRFIVATLLAACTVAATTSAQACGEVMYRMGGALRYQAFVTRHPANILLYADGALAQASANDRADFRRQLEKAGHKVTVADGQAAFERALAERSYDIVITGAANLPALRPLLAHAQREPALIPVIDKGGDQTLRRQYPQALAVDAGMNRFLKDIERTMQTRGT